MNEGNVYPEVYITNNELTCNFYVEGGSEQNTGSSGSGGSKGGPSMGLLIGLVVGIFVRVVLAIGVGLFFVWRYKGDSTSRSGDNSDRYTLLDKN